MTRNNIFLADLTHTALGIHASVFPLGVGCVASYASHELGDEFNIELYKFPEDLAEAICQSIPSVIGLSNFSWNLELSYTLSKWAKSMYPDVAVVFGGPNFPISIDEKIAFLGERPALDFYIQNEGELGFVELVKKLREFGFDKEALKRSEERVLNCSYLNGGKLIDGPIRRIDDINIIPSPYLSGTLDPFFEKLELIPLIETNRGCPFTCTYCADGLPLKTKVKRYDPGRIRKELEYIRERVKIVEILEISDLNFGMYEGDIETARQIAQLKEKYDWPVMVHTAAGKNKPERIIETASILGESWMLGASIQTSDENVLKNIKRNNISIESYKAILDYGNDNGFPTYTDIILALPGDTKATHFESLRFGIENKANIVHQYQAIMLIGTELEFGSTREEFGIVTKFRVRPGCIGFYKFGEERFPIAEIEETIVSTKDMTFEDYLSCRHMNLIVETFINNRLFDEFFASLRAMGVSVFDCLLYMHQHEELYSQRIREIFNEFIHNTQSDLYDTRFEAEEFLLKPGTIERHLSGEIGKNELLEYRALLFVELESISGLLLNTLNAYLDELGLLDEVVQNYFAQLMRLIICRKHDFRACEEIIEDEFDYDFELIDQSQFVVDPRTLVMCESSLRYRFFHSERQKRYIRNIMNTYEGTAGGFARAIQQTNMKMMYRHFERI